MMTSDPVRVPPIVGDDVTETVQVVPAASTLAHVCDEIAKSPLAAIDDIFAATLWLFFSVTTLIGLTSPTDTFPNGTDRGVIVIGVVPLPDRLTTTGELTASELTDSVPLREPPSVGWNVRRIEQVASGARVAPQGVAVGTAESAKSPVSPNAGDPKLRTWD
jgi:hypothetical protein